MQHAFFEDVFSDSGLSVEYCRQHVRDSMSEMLLMILSFTLSDIKNAECQVSFSDAGHNRLKIW